MVDGSCWKPATGAPWRDVPERYGSWKTCYERLRRWQADGTWDRILATCRCTGDGEPLEWSVHIDHTSVRAHQHVAGARQKGAPRLPVAHLAGHRARLTPALAGRWAAPAVG